MDGTTDAVDRISELPDFIIHHIMSYLSAKEVARTCLLSKRWNWLQTSFPVLDFNQTSFGVRYTWFRNERFWECVNKFMEFVDISLLRFCKLQFCMQKFRLCTSLVDGEESSSLIDKWIALAVEKEVKELDIEVQTEGKTMYTLPSIIFSAKLVTTVKLHGCMLKQPTDSICFQSLKKLTLSRVCINGNMVQKITSECPVLEDISLKECCCLKRYCVSNARKLRTVEIFTNSNVLDSVEIVGPSLQRFHLLFYRHSLPHLIDDGLFDFDSARCPHLKELEFYNVPFTNQQINHLISKFPMLENLIVRNPYLLERVTISSNHLKKLKFRYCPDLKAIDIHTPNLLSFYFENKVVPISSIYAPCPWKVFFENNVNPDTRWYLNVRAFLGESNQIEDLTIYVQSEESSFNLDEIRESVSSRPCEVQNLWLNVDLLELRNSTVLDGIFWICHPKTLSVETADDGNNRFIRWLWRKLKKRKTKCCTSHHVKCWRHYLEDVRLEGFRDVWQVMEATIFDVSNLNMDAPSLPRLPPGCLQFRLDWSLHIPIEKP